MPSPNAYRYDGMYRRPRPIHEPLTPQRIVEAYEGGFNRTPTQEEIDSHLGNPGGYRGFLETLRDSDEGQALRFSPREFVAGRGRVRPTDGGSRQQAAPSSWNPSGSYAYRPVEQLGGSAFEGFNDQRALSGGDPRSTKDLFRNVVGGLGINLDEVIGFGPDAMARAEALSRERIIPALLAAGADVLDARNDRILIRTYEHPDGEWVDIYRGAGAPGAAFWWGAGGSNAASASGGRSSVVRPGQGDWRTMPVPAPVRHEDGSLSVSLPADAARWWSRRRQRRRPVGEFMPPTAPLPDPEVLP